MQRLCKYPLLLRELISCTAETHADYSNLITAARDIGVAIERINEYKRKLDQIEELKELQTRVSDIVCSSLCLCLCLCLCLSLCLSLCVTCKASQ
jgi:hypothetical protein